MLDVATQAVPLSWGAPSARERGPVVAHGRGKNVIGGGQYAVWAALGRARSPEGLKKTDFSGHQQAWAPAVSDERIVSLDPWGECVHLFEKQLPVHDLRPSIASCEAWLQVPEIEIAIQQGHLEVDGHVLRPHRDEQLAPSAPGQHQIKVWQISIDPVWYLPGVADRLQVSEQKLRHALCEGTGVQDLIQRPDVPVFLPPVGGSTLYIVGDRNTLSTGPVCVRVHDECNSSDVFGSDVCTCRPYLMYSLQYAIKMAQQGGVGVILYSRKEGRGFGEVPKFWACHQRHQWQSAPMHPASQEARVQNFIQANLNVAGAHDLRFHELVPDVLHWLGVQNVQQFLSMNTNKLQALQNCGIKVEQCVPIDENLVTQHARIEVAAKEALL